LKDLELDEEQVHVLGVYSRPGLEIELIACKLTSAGTSALAEVLGRNQGPTNLYRCEIDYSLFANGLRGNSRLNILTLCPEDNNQQVIAIAGALRENRGLIELNIPDRRNLGRHLLFSQDTSDTQGFASRSDVPHRYYDNHSRAQLPDTGTLGYDEIEHIDTHDTFELPLQPA
jgi:hypothetical protein